MSNIAGKAYAMSLATPIKRHMVFANKFIFWLVGTRLFSKKLNGLVTLSMIHYARWVILKPRQFPRLSPQQPAEDLSYSYMLFFSNFNGSWSQYIDSFSAAIPGGLDLLWWRNVGWPKSVPETPFHRYVSHNQHWTDYYYTAYPMAASNDVKAAHRVKRGLVDLVQATRGVPAEDFAARYAALCRTLQDDLGKLGPSPIVSLAGEAAARHSASSD